MAADSVIKDEGISGGALLTKERNLFQLVRGTELNDTLIVRNIPYYKVRFWGAERTDTGLFISQPNRLRLIICNVGLDIDCSEISAMTELQLSMLSIFAKMEKELIVGRTKVSIGNTQARACSVMAGFASAVAGNGQRH